MTLPPQRVRKCLQHVSRVTRAAPKTLVKVSRYFLAQKASTGPGVIARIHVSLSSDCSKTTSRRMIMGTDSAYFPISFGSPGLLLACFKDLLTADPKPWSCLAPVAKLKSCDVVYMGEYRLRCIGTMTPEECRNQRRKVRCFLPGWEVRSTDDPAVGKAKDCTSFECLQAKEKYEQGRCESSVRENSRGVCHRSRCKSMTMLSQRFAEH